MSFINTSSSHLDTAFNFTNWKAEHIPLDKEARWIKKVTIVAEASFTEKILSKNSYLFAETEFGLSLKSENSYATRNVTHRVIQVISGSVEESTKELEDFLSLYKKKNLPKFQEQINKFIVDATPPSPFPLELKERVICYLRECNIFYFEDKILHTILTIFTQAIKAHEEDRKRIVCISSKSAAFAEINSQIDTYNELGKSLPDNEKAARTSIRILPDGLASITLPGLDVIKGGTKIIKRELVINPDGSVKLMRRYKIQKELRKQAVYDIFTKNIYETLHINTDRIVSPLVVYHNTKNHIEYLARDCDMDVFALLKSYTIKSNNNYLKQFHSLPIEYQSAELLRIMTSSAIALRYLHNIEIIHNDIKPENFLLSYANKKFHVSLCDLDFACNKHLGGGAARYLGTPLYMKQGSPARTIYSDIHALGKTFFLDSKSSKKNVCYVYALEKLKRKQINELGEKKAWKIQRVTEEVKHLSERMQTTSELMHLDTVILELSRLRAALLPSPPTLRMPENLTVMKMQKRNAKTHKRSHSTWI